MSQSELKTIEKNLKLSILFQEYVLKHPDFLNKLPKGAQIILDDLILSSANKKGVYRAIKKGKDWIIQPA